MPTLKAASGMQEDKWKIPTHFPSLAIDVAEDMPQKRLSIDTSIGDVLNEDKED